MSQKWDFWSWRTFYLVLVLLVSGLALGVYFLTGGKSGVEAPETRASLAWCGLALTLMTAFMLGAAQTEKQFLVWFSAAVLGAGAGYLIGVWLTPSTDTQQASFDRVQNILSSLLAGVVGTKLLGLWDDLAKPAEGEKIPRILTPDYFLTVVLALTGLAVSLSGFYTIRSAREGSVSITALKSAFVAYKPEGSAAVTNGVWADSKVQFAGAASYRDDLSVTWDLRQKDNKTPPGPAAKPMVNGLLEAPSEAVLGQWCGKSDPCDWPLNWTVVATSVENRAKSTTYPIRFCRNEKDCPVPTGPPKPAAAAIPPKVAPKGAVAP